MRIHPGVGFPLERIVPAEGATICNVRLPGGTNISVMAPVIHHDKAVFGATADEFRPERWLEASTEELKLMDRNFLAVCVSSAFFRIEKENTKNRREHSRSLKYLPEHRNIDPFSSSAHPLSSPPKKKSTKQITFQNVSVPSAN